jgi:hypothetical protein
MGYKELRKIINERKDIPSIFKIVVIGYLDYAKSTNTPYEKALEVINASIQDVTTENTI